MSFGGDAFGTESRSPDCVWVVTVCDISPLTEKREDHGKGGATISHTSRPHGHLNIQNPRTSLHA